MSLTGISGSVVGPIVVRPAGAGTEQFVSTDIDYTFAIGGIPFFISPSDDNPYQRATAQFRKQQFDASASPGDQSLDGLWLRGQFSFHHGAGIRFFESLDGDATANRFEESVNIDCWTPGAASLYRSLDAVYLTSVVDAAGRKSGGTSHVFALNASNVVQKITAGGSVTALTSGTATSIAANDLGEAFVTAGAKIQVATTANFADQITHSGARTFVNVAWAKGRLFFVDDSGRWYAKPSAAGTVADADAFWNSAFTSAVGDWSVAESPSAVYLGRGSNIYAVLPATDGTVPTLTAPVVAAALPPGETVKALGFNLGWLVIVTDQGVRVAQSSDSGSLSMGPILVDFTDSTCRKVGMWGNHAYVTGMAPGESVEGLWVLDLTEVLGSDVVAYTRRHDSPAANTGSGGVFINGRLAFFGGHGVLVEDVTDASASGSLTTGSIRFGTMEPKAFHSLRVRAEGTEGSITVEMLRRGGTSQTLKSFTVGGLLDTDVDLNLPAPDEYLAFRFILFPGPTGVSPTLLGYQLRALPAPARRSRMISVPLMCYDSETAPNGVQIDRGAGSAFQRLAMLEDIEKDAGLVLFQDLRTGEQATCFLEEVSFINKTAPKGPNTGFGGVLNVTLRLLP